LDREKRNVIGGYDLNPSSPKVTQDKYLEAIHWTSLRTQAAFDMPCCICGYENDVEMHHIKHIRKTPYRELEKITYKQMMALRNRKQIPVCRNCHMNQIHKGEYSGPSLETLHSTKLLVDNRTLHVESFVKPGREYFAKTLPEKGWKKIQPPDIKKGS